MRGLASIQVSPGARTCVVVGAVNGAEALPLAGYRSVLWFTREGGSSPRASGLDPARVNVAPVDPHDPAQAAAVISGLIHQDGMHLPSVIVTDEAVRESTGAYLPVMTTLYAQFESHQRARTTRQEDGFLWQSNVLANLPLYAQRRVPPGWAGALEGLPAYVCGAGPSLDASLPALQKHAGAGVLFAADSALGALARAGLTPDFAVSIDAHKTPVRCLPAGHAPPGRLIVAGVSPPEWRHAVAGERLHFLSGRQLTEDRLRELGVGKTAVSVEENCGMTALALARHLGCGPIYLFGMDHAVDGEDPARWHHRHAPAEADRQIGLAPGRPHPKVPGNFQAEIATPLFREWRALDARCAALPAGLVRNVTDRGARFRNTTVIRPGEFDPGPAAAEKAGRLGRLAVPQPLPARDWAALARAIARLAAEAGPTVERAGEELRAGRPQRCAAYLAGLFRDPRHGLLFGNYGLKIAPHLLRFGEVGPALWRELFGECRGLIALAPGPAGAGLAG